MDVDTDTFRLGHPWRRGRDIGRGTTGRALPEHQHRHQRCSGRDAGRDTAGTPAGIPHTGRDTDVGRRQDTTRDSSDTSEATTGTPAGTPLGHRWDASRDTSVAAAGVPAGPRPGHGRVKSRDTGRDTSGTMAGVHRWIGKAASRGQTEGRRGAHPAQAPAASESTRPVRTYDTHMTRRRSTTFHVAGTHALSCGGSCVGRRSAWRAWHTKRRGWCCFRRSPPQQPSFLDCGLPTRHAAWSAMPLGARRRCGRLVRAAIVLCAVDAGLCARLGSTWGPATEPVHGRREVGDGGPAEAARGEQSARARESGSAVRGRGHSRKREG